MNTAGAPFSANGPDVTTEDCPIAGARAYRTTTVQDQGGAHESAEWARPGPAGVTPGGGAAVDRFRRCPLQA